jgi:hypothetical protein
LGASETFAQNFEKAGKIEKPFTIARERLSGELLGLA